MFQAFFGKENLFLKKSKIQLLEMFGDFVGASDVQKDMSQGKGNFVCATYGYTFLTSVDPFAKEIYVP